MEELFQHLINGINLGAIYALIALGYTMVYGILQLINFAHSDVYMIGAFAAYYGAKFLSLEAHPGLGSFLTLLLVAMLACALLGYVIERFAYRPLRSAPKLNLLITAIGVSLFLEFTGQFVFGADPKVFPEVIQDQSLLQWGAIQIQFFDIVILSVAILVMGGLHFFVKHTKMGKAMRAVSVNARVASLMGIPINQVVSITFMIGSALAGVGSVLVGMKYPKIDPLMGMMIGLKAFVAAVLGGIGNLMGAVLGGLLMGLCEELVVAYLSSTYRDALAFGILIGILIFKPTGLLGSRHVEKV